MADGKIQRTISQHSKLMVKDGTDRRQKMTETLSSSSSYFHHILTSTDKNLELTLARTFALAELWGDFSAL